VKVCEFGIRLINRLVAEPRERLGLELPPSMETAGAAIDGPFDPREAVARREVMVRAIWVCRTILQDCDDAKHAFRNAGCVEVLMHVAALRDLEAQEAALAALVVAVTANETNCRYMLENMELMRVMVGMAEADSGVAAPPLAVVTNAQLARDIL
jgi:hypothetical protein